MRTTMANEDGQHSAPGADDERMTVDVGGQDAVGGPGGDAPQVAGALQTQPPVRPLPGLAMDLPTAACGTRAAACSSSAAPSSPAQPPSSPASAPSADRPRQGGGADQRPVRPVPRAQRRGRPRRAPGAMDRAGGRAGGHTADRRPHGLDGPAARHRDGRLPLRRGVERGRRALGRRRARRAARPGRRAAGGEVRRLLRSRRLLPEHAAARPGPRRASPCSPTS